jgi:uncharacterized protein (TIGR02145 family)
VKATVRISDPNTPSATKVYTFESVGRYPESGEKPVLAGGAYWAPVNAGATELVTDFSNGDENAENDIEMTPANVGYYFQWGRNTRFWQSGHTANFIKYNSIEEAEVSDVFYRAATEHYLSTPRFDLWSGDREQGPCPAGWRVPTSTELHQLVAQVEETDVVNTITQMFTFPGDSGETLYFPASGRLHNATGSYQDAGAVATFWTSSLYDSNTLWRWFAMTSSGNFTAYMNVAWALPVRCVQK